MTPLFHAISTNNYKLAHLLLHYNANPSAVDAVIDNLCTVFSIVLSIFLSQQKQSPLHWAVAAGYDELAVLLTSYGGNVLLEDSVSL